MKNNFEYHPLRYGVDHLQLRDFDPETGRYYGNFKFGDGDWKRVESETDFVPCRSATCACEVCQRKAVEDRVLALRFASRGRDLILITLSKFRDRETADEFVRSLREVMRKEGYYWKDVYAIEDHSTGLYHVHVLVDTDAPAYVIQFNYYLDVEEELELSEWSEFDISENATAKDVEYILKRAEESMSRHLALNKGQLLRSWTTRSNSLFDHGGVKTMKAMTQAERDRQVAFRKLEALLASRFGFYDGIGLAIQLTERLIHARQLNFLTALFRGLFGALKVWVSISSRLPVGAVAVKKFSKGVVVAFGAPP